MTARCATKGAVARHELSVGIEKVLQKVLNYQVKQTNSALGCTVRTLCSTGEVVFPTSFCAGWKELETQTIDGRAGTHQYSNTPLATDVDK